MSTSAPPTPPERHVIKRYSNRKLYDMKSSQYVTLQQVAELVRAGVDIQVVDNATKDDKTEVTLALIISEELKTRPRGIPLTMLKELIRNRGERLLSTLRDGPIAKLIPKDGAEPEPRVEAASAQEELKGIRQDLNRLNDRLRALESRLDASREYSEQPPVSPADEL